MKISIAFASAAALALFCASGPSAMETCLRGHSVAVCHHTLNR